METQPLAHPAIIVGCGLLAGLVGATAMLLSQKAEMAVTGREPSDTPAEAIETATGIAVPDEDKAPLSTAGHFAFGSALGLGLAALDDVPEPARTAAFLAGSWAAGNGLITALGVSEPPTQWKGRQLAVDLLHHAVYATTTVLAFAGFKRLVRTRAG